MSLDIVMLCSVNEETADVSFRLRTEKKGLWVYRR